MVMMVRWLEDWLIDGLIDGLLIGLRVRAMNGWRTSGGWIDGRIGRWIDGRIGRWIGGGVDGWRMEGEWMMVGVV